MLNYIRNLLDWEFPICYYVRIRKVYTFTSDEESVSMNDTQIRHFIALAKIGSFSRAEDVLNITKTALKKQIDALEAELNFSLFIRTPKGLQLTECGQHFLTEANRLYLDFTSLVRECQSMALHSKKIRIGIYSMSSMLNWYSSIDANSDFHIEYIYLSGGNLTHEDNLQLLKDKQIDFLEYEDNQLIYENNLCFRKISTDYLCCVMQDNHPLSQNKEIHPEELNGCELFCWSADSSATRALFDCARRLNLNLQALAYNKNTVLNVCHAGKVYILSHTLAASFQPLKIIPIIPEIPYSRGLVYLPENESLLNDIIAAADPGTLQTGRSARTDS